MCWDNKLRFDGNAGDQVKVLEAFLWTHGADQTISGRVYHTYSTADGAHLLVDTHVTTNLV